MALWLRLGSPAKGHSFSSSSILQLSIVTVWLFGRLRDNQAVAHHAWLARDGHAEHLDVHLLVVVGVHHLAALPGRAQPGTVKEKEQKDWILFEKSNTTAPLEKQGPGEALPF